MHCHAIGRGDGQPDPLRRPAEHLTTARLASSAAQLLAEARRRTGIDRADEAAREPLERLVFALNEEAALSPRGAPAMEERLLRLLSNRLLMQRDFAVHPEILEQEIRAPLILVGGPRTGSTKLHKMLAATGDFLFLPFWQGHCLSLRSGDRSEDPAPRIADAQDYIGWIARYAPLAQMSHGYGAFEPEEEALILEHFICSTFPNVFARVPSFMAWWATQDFLDQASFLKQGLQYLQWQFHDRDPRPWVLKCPIYGGLEGRLAEIFPDASFVVTNRDPQNTIASTANLVHGYRQAYSDADWRVELGHSFLHGLAASAKQQRALRDERPDLRICDVAFSDLATRSEKVIEDVYTHARRQLSDSARAAVRDWDAANRLHDRALPYVPADFGLSKAVIAEAYAGYTERFRRYY